MYQNIFELESVINKVIISETGLTDLGLYCIQEKAEGRPVSSEERKWMWEAMQDGLKKHKYTVINDLWDFIPDRLKAARLFNWLVGAGDYNRIMRNATHLTR